MSKWIDIEEMKRKQKKRPEDLLDVETHKMLLSDWVDKDARMRQEGVKRVTWDSDYELPPLETWMVTRSGKHGQLVDWGLQKDADGIWKRTIVIMVGSSIEVMFPRDARPMTRQEFEDKDKKGMKMDEIKNDTETTIDTTEATEKLEGAMKKAEKQQTQSRERRVKGSHLLESMLKEVTDRGLKTEERSGFTKITGTNPKLVVYLAKKGGRVDISGFQVTAEAVNLLTEEEARAKHIGKVRAQVNFDMSDDQVMDAFRQALDVVVAGSAEELASTPATASAAGE